jgi:N-methylhydantoinase A
VKAIPRSSRVKNVRADQPSRARRPAGKQGALRIGIDTGGTFTDFVLIDGGRSTFLKVPSTPAEPARAVLEGLERLEANLPSSSVVHGSTVATNALLERKGGPTALLTTAGFEDLVEIGRQARPDLYDWNASRPDPLVPRRFRFGVNERVHPDGTGHPPDERELDRLAKLGGRLKRQGVKSIAVCFLHSYREGRNEDAVGESLGRLGLPVTLSHSLVNEFREYERFSTACANAFLQPVVGKYLQALEAGIAGSLRVLQSSGLSAPCGRVAAEPVHAVLSGPAGGVLAAWALSARAGAPRLIAFDMGGTSTDVALVDGALPFTVESRLAGTPIRVPAVAVESVGAGGGSIAGVDAGGALRVGPESAGADPGPACYGKGSKPTVTDANLVLGRLRGDELLGGEMRVEEGRAWRAIESLAVEMSRVGGGPASVARCAEGVIAVANANMERALRAVSMQKGHDPRLFTLICYGGAGGLHACALASAVGIRRIIVPPSPGTFSAFGMVLGPVGRDESRTVLQSADRLDRRRIQRLFSDLESRASRTLRREGIPRKRLAFERFADLRYHGQSHEVTVSGHGDLLKNFHARYRRLFGEAREGTAVELVTARVRARERGASLPRLRKTTPRVRTPRPAFVSTVVFDGSALEVPAFRRDSLGEGAVVRGPARILEYSSTILMPPSWRAVVDRGGNVILEARGRARRAPA